MAIDAERASGYRYSARAYLVQLRREGSGTALVDPIAFDDLDAAAARRSATPSGSCTPPPRTCACLAEVGLRPTTLFDTELAGRLLGYPRVGLATLVETVVGRSLRKEHSAVDWSTRPLPEPWLEYAALDVEALVELREALGRELEETGKAEWARQEFAHLVSAEPRGPARGPVAPHVGHAPGPRPPRPGRRTRAVGDPRRDRRAAATSPPAGSSRTRRSSRPPTRCPATRRRCWPPRASAAAAPSATRTSGSRRCGVAAHDARRGAAARRRAVRRSAAAPRLGRPGPGRGGPAGHGPRAALKALADEHGLPVENLLTPDYVRRVHVGAAAGPEDTEMPGPGRRAARRRSAPAPGRSTSPATC